MVVPHAKLPEVTGMVLVEARALVLQTAGLPSAAGVLSVSADSTVTHLAVAAALA
eukprot:XP_001704051.1 Hypothetical protein GL50803_38460 [Giardia lamblia ATCC 50803]